MSRNETVEIEELGTHIPENTLEEDFKLIEDVIEKLEDPDVAIEDAFKEYESGMKLLKKCNDRLDLIEKKVMAVGADGELHEF